jgi:hypothetical protein
MYHISSKSVKKFQRETEKYFALFQYTSFKCTHNKHGNFLRSITELSNWVSHVPVNRRRLHGVTHKHLSNYHTTVRCVL